MDGTAAGPPPAEIIQVDDQVVACDGGDNALGHPRVFLHIEEQSVMCPYCSRLYVLVPGSSSGTGGGHGAGH
jgi:uncharacterized Zn-finger protein